MKPSYLIDAFVCRLMKHGKKEKARKLLQQTFTELQRRHPHTDPFTFLQHSVLEASIPMELKKRKLAGRTIFVPFPLHEKRTFSKALSLILLSTRQDRSRKPFPLKLASLLDDTSQNSGKLLENRNQLLNTLRKHQGNMHYRWS